MAELGVRRLTVARSLRGRLGRKANTVSKSEDYNQLVLFDSHFPSAALHTVPVGDSQTRQLDPQIRPFTTATDDDPLDSSFEDADSDRSFLHGLDDNLIGLFEDDEEVDEEIVDALDGELLGEPAIDREDLEQIMELDILPRLQRAIEHRGYLTLGNLSVAVARLQASQPHLEELRTFIQRANVPLVPSRSHQGVRDVRVEDVRVAEHIFGDLIQGAPDSRMVIERLGYAGVSLSDGTRDFLMQVWMGHRLARVEERIHCTTVAQEVARKGSDITRWSSEALAARESLVVDNLWLVARIARKYIGNGLEIEDLLQEGAGGLFDAVVRFDPSLGYRFGTYASSWVFQRITRALANQSRTIRLPIHMIEWLTKVNRATEDLESALGREPMIEELAAQLEVDTSRVAQALHVSQPILSIDTLTNEQRTKHDRDQFRQEPDPVLEAVVSRSAADEVTALLSNLNTRERRILELRFGLEGGRPWSLEEVGQIYGLTRERIRQIQAKAIEKLQRISKTGSLGEQSNKKSPSKSPNLLGVRTDGRNLSPRDARSGERNSRRRAKHCTDAGTEESLKTDIRRADQRNPNQSVAPMIAVPRATANLESKVLNDVEANLDTELHYRPILSVALHFLLRKTLLALPKEDQELVIARFGLMRPGPMPLTEIVARFEVTTEYVIDLQSRLFDELGHIRIRNEMLTYLDTVDRRASALDAM